jgi:hypothetical protein
MTDDVRSLQDARSHRTGYEQCETFTHFVVEETVTNGKVMACAEELFEFD